MRYVVHYCRRHWPAIVAMLCLAWQMSREQNRDSVAAKIFLGLGAAGMALNLIVIFVNGGMPARVSDDEIPEDAQPHYRPIDETTRLAYLADWIPLGNLLISPGDVLLLVAVVALLLRALLGW